MISFFTVFEIGTSEIRDPMPKHFYLPVSVLASVSVQINEKEWQKERKKKERERKMPYFCM